MANNRVKDGKHHIGDLRYEMILTEAAREMPNDLLVGLFADAMERGIETGQARSYKVALIFGRELERRNATCVNGDFNAMMGIAETKVAWAKQMGIVDPIRPDDQITTTSGAFAAAAAHYRRKRR